MTGCGGVEGQEVIFPQPSASAPPSLEDRVLWRAGCCLAWSRGLLGCSLASDWEVCFSVPQAALTGSGSQTGGVCQEEDREECRVPQGRASKGAQFKFSGEAESLFCPGSTLSRHFHCLLSIDLLSVSQQAESEMPWGWGPPAKGLTHRVADWFPQPLPLPVTTR